MSQFFQGVTAGSLPPSVPTSFTTNEGTATPLANVLLIHGIDSIEDNPNGIIVKGGVVGTGTQNLVDVVLTNRITVTSTTSDGGGQTQTATLITPDDQSAFSFTCSFIGYDAINDEAAGGSQEGVARKSAGTAVIIGTNDSSDQSDAGLAAVDWNVVASGGDLEAEFVGVAGRTITWTATFIYSQTGV